MTDDEWAAIEQPYRRAIMERYTMTQENYPTNNTFQPTTISESSTHPTVFCSASCEQEWTAQWGEFDLLYRGAIENIEAASDTCLWCDKPTRER